MPAAVNELLNDLEAAGVKVWLEDDRLRYSAPPGALSDELRTKVAAERDALIAALNAELAIPRADRTQPLPVSWAQQSLWLLGDLSGRAAAANEQFIIRFTGNLDIERLAGAWQRLMLAHEGLRLRLVTDGGEARQVFDDDSVAIGPALSLADRADPEAALLEHAAEMRSRPLDPQQGSLVRPQLFELGDVSHALLVTAHHLVADGPSVELLIEDLAAAYRNPESSLPAADAIQYADYAAWERARDPDAAAWKSRLDGAPTLIDLPPGDPQRSPADLISVAVDIETSDVLALKALGDQHQASLFMVLMALYREMLRRYATAGEVLIGSPVSQRYQPGTERLVGCMVNNLPFRCAPDPTESLAAALAVERAAALEVFADSDVPLERIVRAINPVREAGVHPLFQALFLYAEESVSRTAGDALELHLDLPSAGASSWWDVELKYTGGAQLVLSARPARVSATALAGMAELLGNLVRSACTDSQQQLGELAALPLLPVNGPDFDTDAEATLDSLFVDQAAKTPQAAALLNGAEQITYGELERRSSGLAAALLDGGARPGDTVGVAAADGVLLVAASLAVWRAGCVLLPLDTRAPAERLGHMLALAAPTVILSDSPASLPALPAGARLLSAESVSASASAELPRSGRSASDAAFILFTSGSTGRPKGVVHDHAGAINRVLWFWRDNGFSPEP